MGEHIGHNPSEEQRYRFTPYAEQSQQPKGHVIRLEIDFSTVALQQGLTSACCDAPLQTTVITHTFGWGDTERLDVDVPNTPAYQCGGCDNTFLPGEVALPVKARARAINRYFSFLTAEDQEVLRGFLLPYDVAKIDDFAQAMRQEPYFIQEGTFGPVQPLPPLSKIL